MIKNWWLAFRPKTLTAAVVPIVAATALVIALKLNVNWWVSLLALMASVFIQIGTNLVNDAIDFKKGADSIDRLGPKRVTQSGIFDSKTVLLAAIYFFILAVIAGLPLVVMGGKPILIIGILSLFFAYSYTGGPFPLAYKGLGDLFVILFFGVIAVAGLVYLHTGLWLKSAFVLGIQIGLLCAVLIAINNLRDVEGDQKVNKKTLPVRFGKKFARYEIAVLCLLPFLMNIYWLLENDSLAAFLPALTLPLAIFIVRSIFKVEPSSEYNNFLAKSAILHLLFGVLISAGLVL